ncbi:MAG: hypothetical protein V3S51_06860 [Dehalococcoidia bacterium]
MRPQARGFVSQKLRPDSLQPLAMDMIPRKAHGVTPKAEKGDGTPGKLKGFPAT